ncbi:MAG TPA: OmpA family protein, partial [Allocoleopsis sp.]
MARPLLGDIDLQQVQKIETEEDQVFTQHSIPALEGDFFQQGLGRRATWVKLTGVLTGAEVQDGLKRLRDKFRAAEPVDFVADITTATKVNQVIIEEMGVRELAGKPSRFEYALTLREYVSAPAPRQEPPPPVPPRPHPLESGTLIVEVVVEGEPNFDYNTVTVTVEGTQEDGTSVSRTLTNRSENIWTEDPFPVGQYTVRAVVTDPPPMNGSVKAVVRGRQTTQVTITLRRDRPTNIAKEFVVHFRFDNAFVEPCMRHVLRKVADYARNHPDEKLLIVGNTDKSGSDDYNLSLGDRRARSVYAYLTFGRDATTRSDAL